MKILCTNNIKFPGDNPFEVVERKGIGHPDTVADAIAEKISVEYSKYSLDHFGAVLHHNIDKFAVLGGLVDVDWGKGQMMLIFRKILSLILHTRLICTHNSFLILKTYTFAMLELCSIY